ncbi:type II toxin-antitoxin system HipA family toxin [Candidatus Thiodictyon syntrophicum]|jgi:serine/threonine-protein kinase HipA|uniref:Phosphatidylinositol kinase n=1 Tax=Candidatus Thiodictyon syntrophicum TaxID=1166950 RepID=A0A2K8U7P5_9GAMM|nr:type II toxin-antitoxin system HipA family toxin [Candidatus Thiodictyon syntrophicum]AUB81602.1 phosphatidylinositol kinase [Candidatus Thiodictyon syntrophicum]
MTSEADVKANRAYVWVWLPGSQAPVVAGVLRRDARGGHGFAYGRSYLRREDAISLFPDELPLQAGEQRQRDDDLPSCLRDAAPDAWGRRVIINRLTGRQGQDAALVDLNELTYLLESGSERIGALDFQASSSHYRPRESAEASLDDLLDAALRLEHGEPLSPALALALQHGTSVGGARPKALLTADTRKYIAKFSTSNDISNFVKAEFLAMGLASLAGLEVAPVALTRSLGREVLLIERFDRVRRDDGWQRRAMLSALTLLGLREMEARYASYEDLAHRVRRDFADARRTLDELYGRMVFNVLCGNTDDHARNHAAFWDGRTYRLTPAYDLCPQLRTGGEASQAMLLTGERRDSRLTACLAAAPAFGLGAAPARALIDHQIAVIGREWESVCDAAGLAIAERRALWQRQFLNPYCLEGYRDG